MSPPLLRETQDRVAKARQKLGEPPTKMLRLILETRREFWAITFPPPLPPEHVLITPQKRRGKEGEDKKIVNLSANEEKQFVRRGAASVCLSFPR